MNALSTITEQSLPMPNHRSAFVRLVLSAVFALPAIVVTAGCASTPQHESAGEYTDDSAITAKVKTALLRDPGLKSLAVSVETYRGQVLLSGFVDSQVQIEKAVATARAVSGVQSVNNDLHVKQQ
jgi:hyperosmotically inducible protein